MIKYENYLSICWKLNTSQAPQNFIRSQFTFGTRQRRALRGYPQAGFSIVADAAQVQQFKKLWFDLDYGAKKFLTDQPIFGDFNNNKEVRFTSAYQLQELGAYMYLITCSVEMTRLGKPTFQDCGLVPGAPLVPHIPLVPCHG